MADKWTKLDYVATTGTPPDRMRPVRHLRIDYTIDPDDGNANNLRMASDK